MALSFGPPAEDELLGSINTTPLVDRQKHHIALPWEIRVQNTLIKK
jgi:hypothetical protein